MSECQEKDDLITSEGIETSQGGAVETGPFEEYAGWDGDTIHPISITDMNGVMPCRPGLGIVSELEPGENHKPLTGILWGRLKRAHHNRQRDKGGDLKSLPC